MSDTKSSSMSGDDKRKIAADCWRRGNEAIAKENWDYGIQMYFTAVKLIPDNLMYRQSLRFTEYKKYNNNGTGATMASMRSMGSKGSVKKSRMTKNWQAVDVAAEEGLQVNPWDVGFNGDVGDAAKAQGFPEVAIFAYEEALKKEPTNKEINMSLAEVLEERGEYKRASDCWRRILKLEPTNGTARSKITSLDAKGVMDRGGYEGAEGTRGVMAPHEVARRMGTDGKAGGPGSSPIADMERAVRKDPTNRDQLMKLADLYRREGRLEDAEQQLLKSLELSGGNINVREVLEDVQLDLMRKAVTVAQEQFRADTADESKKQRAVAMSTELLNREVEVIAARVERYPQDMRMKFELATRLMKQQKWATAIPLLQQSRSDPRVKGEALVNLGKCFQYDNKEQLARRQFEAAIPEITHEAHPELFKDLFYFLGRLCEKSGDKPAAEEYYQKVLEVDYAYRDAVTRLNSLQGGESAG
ncbi:MAG: tetratricopeptide repeat protein [Planctomycetaceae bacterium]|nr:MAG: tetratricopeptide repeat protein [Planctomycetaceae bacterium]